MQHSFTCTLGCVDQKTTRTHYCKWTGETETPYYLLTQWNKKKYSTCGATYVVHWSEHGKWWKSSALCFRQLENGKVMVEKQWLQSLTNVDIPLEIFY